MATKNTDIEVSIDCFLQYSDTVISSMTMLILRSTHHWKQGQFCIDNEALFILKVLLWAIFLE